MSQVLSQNEVDALLSSVMEGELEEMLDEKKEPEAPAQAAAPAAAPVPQAQAAYQPRVVAPPRNVKVDQYDLFNQDRIMRGNMPMLEVVHDKFCRDFRTALAIDFRKVVDVEVGDIKLIKMQDFLNRLPIPSCMSIFSMDPLTGNGLVTFDSEFVFVMVDIACGGPGKSRFRVEGREFSGIELNIVEKVVVRALEDWQNAWTPIHHVEVRFARTEINPQFVSIAHPTEVVVLFNATIDIEGVTGGMTFVLPYAMIEPLKERLAKGVVGERKELEKVWKENMARHINESRVSVRGVFGNVQMTVGRLLGLEVGDLIDLDAQVGDPVVLEVEGMRKFMARTGIYRGSKAVQIIGAVEEH